MKTRSLISRAGCEPPTIIQWSVDRLGRLFESPLAPTTDLFPAEGQHWVTSYFICDWDGTPPRIIEPLKCAQLGSFEWDDLPARLFSGVGRVRERFPDLRAI